MILTNNQGWPNPVVIAPPIIILAGNCDNSIQEKIESYSSVLIDAFSGFKGTILSGGTPSGIGKITADIGDMYRDSITTIGYLPYRAVPETRYNKLVHTSGKSFSIAEPLRMWNDIILNNSDPSKIKLIGVGGGVISAGEYRLAIALGARVGLIIGSGRSASEMMLDPIWGRMVTTLESDAGCIRKFIECP